MLVALAACASCHLAIHLSSDMLLFWIRQESKSFGEEHTLWAAKGRLFRAALTPRYPGVPVG